MANRNFYRVVLSNEYLGISKEISAPSRYELNSKIANQERIWNEKIQRELNKQNKEEMKAKAEKLTQMDKNKIEVYSNILKHVCTCNSEKYYEEFIDKGSYEEYESKIDIPDITKIKEEINVPRKSFLEIFSAKKKEVRLHKEQEAEELLKKRTEEYNISVKNEKEFI